MLYYYDQFSCNYCCVENVIKLMHGGMFELERNCLSLAWNINFSEKQTFFEATYGFKLMPTQGIICLENT